MAELFNITHDAGNLAEYNSVVDVDGHMTVTAGAALAGTAYGLNCYINDNTVMYGQKTIASPASNELRFRHYIDPNTITMANYNQFSLMQFNSQSLAMVTLYKNDTPSYSIVVLYANDAWSYTSLGPYNITDAPHYVEVAVVGAASAGTIGVWIDGGSVGSASGIDNDAMMDAVSYVRFGAAADIDTGTRGTIFLDEFKMTDDADVAIGPVTAASSIAAIADYYRRLHT